MPEAAREAVRPGGVREAAGGRPAKGSPSWRTARPGAFTLAFASSVAKASYIPLGIAANSLAAITPKQDALSPWAGLGVLSLYAVPALGAAGWLLTSRDT